MQGESYRQLRQLGVRLPLTRVGDANPYDLGVFQSKLAERGRLADAIPPYVRRPGIDNELDAAQRDNTLVLVVGPSKAGKSRSAFQALSHRFPSRVMLVALPDREHRLFETLPKLPRVDYLEEESGTGLVIWVDDGGVSIETGDLRESTIAGLRDLYDGRVVIVVTMVDDVLNDLQFSSDLGVSSRASQLLRSPLVARVEVPPALEPEELEEAKREYPLFRDDPLLVRLAGFFAAVEVLKRRYDERRRGREFDIALIQAARDWRRAGMPEYISALNLRALAGMYAARLNPGSSLAKQFDTALGWATAPTESGAPMLEESPSREGPQSFRVFDALYEQIKAVDGPVPPETWLFVIHQMRAVDLEGVFPAALQADYDYAIQAARKVARSSGPQAAAAGWALAGLLEQLGDLDSAKTEYERLLGHQDATVVTATHLYLGLLKQRQEEFEDAGFHFTQASELAPAMDLRAQACLSMAGLQRTLGKADDEMQWKLTAVQTEALSDLETVLARNSYCHAELAELLPFVLGSLLTLGRPAGLDERGMPLPERLTVGQQGSESDLLSFVMEDEQELLPVFGSLFWQRAAVNQEAYWGKFGSLLVNGAALLTNIDDGVALVINFQSPLEYVLPSRREFEQRSPGLAGLTRAFSLLLGGDTTSASRVLRTGDVAAQAPTAEAIGRLLECHGQPDTAMLWYQCMIASGHREVSLLGNFLLGRQLERQGNWERAIEHYKTASLSGDLVLSSQAHLLQGQLLLGHGASDLGLASLRAALDSGGLSELEKAILPGHVSIEQIERAEAYVFWKPGEPRMQPQDEGTFQLQLTKSTDGVPEVDTYTRKSGCQDALKARPGLLYYEVQSMPLIWLMTKLLESVHGVRLWINRDYGPSFSMEARRDLQREGNEPASPS
jgi:tetratricopeptide (TPR) repeat protein